MLHMAFINSKCYKNTNNNKQQLIVLNHYNNSYCHYPSQYLCTQPIFSGAIPISVQVLQTRRLTYFGPVTRMQMERYTRVLKCMVIPMVTATREDQRNGLTIFVKTALTWTFHYIHEASHLTSDRTTCRNTVQHMGCQCVASLLSSQRQ